MVVSNAQSATEDLPDELRSVVDSQLSSLDDTDALASAWADALQRAHESNSPTVSWGGRGKGGRGLARRTYQPHDVVVENVGLQYVSDSHPSLPGKTLLDGATLKLLSCRVYALVGRNGCGKSTLLRRIHAGKIPGFSSHFTTKYIAQEVINTEETALEYVLGQHQTYVQQSQSEIRHRIEELEHLLEQLDMTLEDAELVEKYCEQISDMEQELDGNNLEQVRQEAQQLLSFFGIDESTSRLPCESLSGGIRKKVLLANALFGHCDLLLLDEPTNYLDVAGLIQLRRLIDTCVEKRGTTVLLVSHDVDLINDMATDVIHFHNQTLSYYPGNYSDFCRFKRQRDVGMIRKAEALRKQREHMVDTIHNMMKAPAGKRGGTRKKNRAIASRKKKLERHGLERDANGHHFSAQKAGTAIRAGSIKSMDASTRNKLSHKDILKRTEASISPVPDKEVQFIFRNTTSTWGEPLAMMMDVGDGYAESNCAQTHAHANDKICEHTVVPSGIKKQDGLFDCVDMCINEGSTTCIVGANGSGKTTLLRIIAKERVPKEGRVHHAQNVVIAHFDQHVVDDLIREYTTPDKPATALTILKEKFCNKTEQDLRGELTNFGLSPRQASTNVRFLSGGERSRLCLAVLMLGNPHVLVLDEPTRHLDIESVEALLYGIKKWNGTVVVVSHDAHFIRELEGDCFVIMENEGKVRRISQGIDTYLRAYTL